jgi:hypothetical protein
MDEPASSAFLNVFSFNASRAGKWPGFGARRLCAIEKGRVSATDS